MPEKRKQYDEEFQAGAVRIVFETGKTIAQVARDLDVNEGTLGSWVQTAREGPMPVPARVDPELPGDVEVELRRLGPRSRSCGWSVMSSSDPWSCG